MGNISTLNKRFNSLSNNNALWNKLIKLHYDGHYDTETIDLIISTYKPKLSKETYKLIHILYINNNFNSTVKEIVETKHVTCRAIGGDPNSISNLVNLKELSMDHTGLSVLPPGIGNLKNLVTLKLRFNKLTSLPQEISMLTNLTHLDIYDNEIKCAPEVLYDLTNLRRLQCDFPFTYR